MLVFFREIIAGKIFIKDKKLFITITLENSTDEKMLLLQNQIT